MATQPSDTLLLELETFAVPVGFRKSSAHAANAIPPDLQLWESDFALLALVRAGDSDVGSLAKAFANASDWMLLSLKAEEKKGRLFDGYLLFALSSKPEGDLLAEVRRIEGDTRVCRKHVLWPDEDHSWSTTLSAVTTLGLPSATVPDGAAVEPTLSISPQRALEARDEGISFEDVALMIEALPEDNSDTNGHVN